MKRKLWKEIILSILFLSSILSFSPIAYGKTISLQQSIDAIKMEMKKAALSYVEPALEGELVSSSSLDSVLNSVKKNYQETRKIILASNLSEKEKQAKLKEIDALYQEKIVKGLIPYIDAYNYATKYLDPLLKEIQEAERENDFATVEKAYHELSVQLKSRTSILYRFTGKAPRDLLLEKYKRPADIKRDELIIPVTIIMKLTNAQQLFLEGKKEEAIKSMEDIPSLVAKLSSSNLLHQGLLNELEKFQTILSTSVTPATPGSSVDNNGPSETSAQRALRLAKKNAIAELTDYKVEADYSSTNWTTILSLITDGTNTINKSTSVIAVSDALSFTKLAIDQIKTQIQEAIEANEQALNQAKTNAINELTDYKVAVQADYSFTNWTVIEGLKAAGIIAIDAATTAAEVTQAKDDAQAAIDLIQIKSQVSTVSGITVNGITAVEDALDQTIYNVELPAGTILENATILVTPTDANAVVGQATTVNNGATWEVVVTSEDGKSTTTYRLNITFTTSIGHVTITLDSFGVAGNGEITNLTSGGTYAVIVDGTTYGVSSDGLLTISGSEPLSGTKIIGLDTTKSYKVFDSRIVYVTPTELNAGNIDGSIINLNLQKDIIIFETFSWIQSSTFTGDFKNVTINIVTYTSSSNNLKFDLSSGTVVNETGRATLTIPGEIFTSGKDLIVHFTTTSP